AEAADRADLREVDVGVDEAGDEQPAVQPGDRLAGMRLAQRGERTPSADDAVPDQQSAVLGQRFARVTGERVARRVDDGPGVNSQGVVPLASGPPPTSPSPSLRRLPSSLLRRSWGGF